MRPVFDFEEQRLRIKFALKWQILLNMLCKSHLTADSTIRDLIKSKDEFFEIWKTL